MTDSARIQLVADGVVASYIHDIARSHRRRDAETHAMFRCVSTIPRRAEMVSGRYGELKTQPSACLTVSVAR